MSQQYDNNNSGVLFKNEDKQQESHADYRGNINIEGKEFWLDARLRKSKAGKTFMSLKVKPKQPRTESAPQREQVPGPKTDEGFSDEIPFIFAFAVPVATLLASMVFGFGGMVA